VLRQGIQGISELITVPALINLDFADVRTIMSEGGAALMAVGRAAGDDRARRAAELAISSGLLDVTIDGARGILFNITGGTDLSLFEVNEAAAIIKESAHPEVNLIFGAQIDENMGDEVRITVIATGFEQSRVKTRMDAQNVLRPPTNNQRPQNQYNQNSQPLRPMQPVQNQPPVQPPPQQNQPPQVRPGQPPQRPTQDTFTTRVYDEDDMDIPPFLRPKK